MIHVHKSLADRIGLLAWTVCLAHCLPLAALAAPAHEHGTATLDVAFEGSTLSLTLESPLDNLAGFEHAPKNDKQRAALARMETTLRGSHALLLPTPEAACQQTESAVDSPFPVTPGAKPAAGDGDGHAEATARWSFKCAKPEALSGIEVKIFDAFTGLRRLKVQAVTPRGQSSTTLTPKKRVLSW